MNWLLAAAVCILLVELTLRLSFADALGTLILAGRKAVRVILAKHVSDHWKEKALAAYTRAVFLSTLRLAGLVVIVLASAVVSVLVIGQFFEGFETFMIGAQGVVFTFLLAALYLTVRKFARK